MKKSELKQLIESVIKEQLRQPDYKIVLMHLKDTIESVEDAWRLERGERHQEVEKLYWLLRKIETRLKKLEETK